MKRKSFQVVSTLILGASVLAGSIGIAPPTYAADISASAVDPNLLPIGTEMGGKRYWSIAELQTASELINAKREEFCKGDKMCEEELVWQQMEEFGGIYQALDPYENTHFILTSINSSANTIKLLYHDEDKMLSRMLGEAVRYDISTLYVVWVDESIIGDPSKDARWLAYDYRYPFHLGSEEEAKAATHIIMDESETELGHGWFTPNIEHEYYAPDSDLAANAKKWLYFSFNAVPDGGHSSGILDYSSCINSPDYVDGMECKLMYADDGSRAYFPVMPTVSTLLQTTPEPVTTLATESEISKSETPVDLAIVESTSTTTTSQDPVGTPNTGTATREECGEEEHIFPWWLVVLMIFGSAFIIFSWWFLLPLFKNPGDGED